MPALVLRKLVFVAALLAWAQSAWPLVCNDCGSHLECGDIEGANGMTIPARTDVEVLVEGPRLDPRPFDSDDFAARYTPPAIDVVSPPPKGHPASI